MKTVFLNEESLDRIYNTGIIENLPIDILDAIKRDETSIGNNPAIPDVFGDKFVEKLTEKRFLEIKKTLEEVCGVGSMDFNNPAVELSKVLNECKELEKPNRDALEKICINHVINLLNVPQDALKISAKLTDNVEYDSESFIVDPIKDDDYVLNDFHEAKAISLEILKRKLINALCVGAGLSFSSDVDSYLSDVSEIDPKLPELYKKFIALNNYCLFTSNEIGITDDNKKQTGIVNVKLGSEDEQPVILAQGEILPILMAELIHGLFELFASHGLPKDIRLTREILKRTDYIKANPWDMRVGEPLWDILFTVTKADNAKTTDLPYLFYRIVQLPIKKFNLLMQEVFAKTRRGERIISKIIEKTKRDKILDKYKEKMPLSDTDKTIITDDYLNEEEF